MDKKQKKGKEGLPITLYNNRLCVRRGFRMYASNKELLESSRFSKYRPSDVLHDALSLYFASIRSTPIEQIRIPGERVNRQEATNSRLYIELENNTRINDLTERNFKIQDIINHALKLYLEK